MRKQNLFKKNEKFFKNSERSGKFLGYVLKSRKVKWATFLKKLKRPHNLQRPYKVLNNYSRALLIKRSEAIEGFQKSKKLCLYITASGFTPSQRSAVALINQGAVLVNGAKVLFPNMILSSGDLVQIKAEGTQGFDLRKEAKLRRSFFEGLEISFSTKSFVVCF